MKHAAFVLLPLIAFGCTTEIPAVEREPIELDPFMVDDSLLADVDRQGVLERRAIFLANQLASDVFEDAANVQFGTLGFDIQYEDRPLTPASDREGEVMGADFAIVIDAEVPAGADALPEGSCAFAVAPAAVDPSSISCRFLARETMRQAMTRGVQALADEPLEDSFMRDARDPEAVQSWYTNAFEFGIQAGSPAFIDALRDAGACDQEPTQEESAGERGNRVGRGLMMEATATQEGSTPDTVCNIDTGIVNPARSAAMAGAPLAGETPLCEGYVAQGATESARLQAAQQAFADGIEAGIAEQARAESARLLRTWTCRRPQSEGGDGGGSGDPLVLDFDGDGFIHVESIRNGARFDFNNGDGLVATEWPLGDALLVLDNGDGSVEAGELFGDVSEFSDGSSAVDGLDAAAMYDAVERGGNADGRLDSADSVYAELSVWVDDNGDAQADAGELTSLEDAGVQAVDFTHGRWFDADGGEHALADVWLSYER